MLHCRFFIGFYLLKEQACSPASRGYYIACVNPFRADLLGKCLFWLRQNLSFVIIPLKIACIGSSMSRFAKMSRGYALGIPMKIWRCYATWPSISCVRNIRLGWASMPSGLGQLLSFTHSGWGYLDAIALA
jgi:hypothetical protein